MLSWNCFILQIQKTPLRFLMSLEINELPSYTRAQLALRNGQDRDEIWIAYQGIIYDVTASRLWRNGKHYEHWAGQDLTDELPDAPHNEQVFERLQVVGKVSQ
jgi:predicted heme/steroid binding protein